MLFRLAGSARAAGAAMALSLLGCQAPAPKIQAAVPAAQSPETAGPQHAITLELPDAWGGELLCTASECHLGAVEHENNKLSLFRLQGRTATRLDQQPLGYHPDSAAWATPELLVAAVEKDASLDVFQVKGGKLSPTGRIHVGFAPRDVISVPAPAGRHRMLATPYAGTEVAWVEWGESQPLKDASVKKVSWCQTPWHPVRVSRLPQAEQGGVAVACLDDKKVVGVSSADLYATPKVLASFTAIPRQARPSPSGQWLYVALETGGRNARIHMQTGELQWIQGDPRGSSAVAALSDDLVIWGDDQRLTLQRLDDKAAVVETRTLRTSGYSTDLLLGDIDKDGQPDVVVLNSAGQRADVIYGPLWDHALRQP